MEMLERCKVCFAFLLFFTVITLQYDTVSAAKNRSKMYYVCPQEFIRLGHSCYYFSTNKATWQKALFSCKDRNSNLTVPARWEDRRLRSYLSQEGIEKVPRWIGGIYDYIAQSFKWGGELKEMKYHSSLAIRKMEPEELKWHCIAMVPESAFKWGAKSCVESHKYICKTSLKKISKRERNELRKKGLSSKANEITAPSLDVPLPTANTHLKSVDVRPAELRKRENGARRNRKITRPFVGYVWNRNDPEAAYRQNMEILRSGKSGLTDVDAQSWIRRLKRRRDRRLKVTNAVTNGIDVVDSDWLTSRGGKRAKTTKYESYTVDNNNSNPLYPKAIVEVLMFDDKNDKENNAK